MTRLDPAPNVIDFAALGRQRKVRYICKAIVESVGRRMVASPANVLAEAKLLTLEGRLMAEARAHQLMGTKKPRASSDTTWALVMEELESRVDESEDES